MIKQVNLLDKLFYIHNGRVYEVTVVSKVYEDIEHYGWRDKYKAVNIIFNDEVIGVDTKDLYYTRKEAYEELLKVINEEIVKKEQRIREIQLELKDLYGTYNSIINKINDEQ